VLDACVVRAWRKGDARAIARWADNPRVARNLRDRFPHPYTLADAKRWIRAANAYDPPTHFAIEADGEAVGGIGFDVFDDVDRRTAEIGYWLAEPYWGRGIATAAVTAVSEYAFHRFDLARLQARVFEGNDASMRVLEKAGYEREGRLRRSVTKGDRTIDSYIYARVRD
jgi:RimJ/RimL family protein N-acetyltransferase